MRTAVIFAKDVKQAAEFLNENFLFERSIHVVTGPDPAQAEGWMLHDDWVFILLPFWFEGKSKEYVIAVSRCAGMPYPLTQ